MTETSRLGEKGQAVIPKPIRDAAGISPGDLLAFRLEAGRIVVEKADRVNALEDLLALVPKKRKEPKRIDWDAVYGSQFER